MGYEYLCIYAPFLLMTTLGLINTTTTSCLVLVIYTSLPHIDDASSLLILTQLLMLIYLIKGLIYFRHLNNIHNYN